MRHPKKLLPSCSLPPKLEALEFSGFDGDGIGFLRQVLFGMAQRGQREAEGNQNHQDADSSIYPGHLTRLIDKERAQKRPQRDGRPGEYAGNAHDSSEKLVGNNYLAQAASVDIEENTAALLKSHKKEG